MTSPFLPGRTDTSQELVLQAAAGTLRLPLALPERDARGGTTGRRRSTALDLSGQWAAGEGNLQDVPRRVHTFARGAGYTRKPPEFAESIAWDGFAESSNACTRFGYVCPSGEQTVTAVGGTWGLCNKIISFNGDLFFIHTNVIGYRAAGTGALTSLYTLAGDTFLDAEVWAGALRVSGLCSHSGAGKHQFVTLTPGGAPYTITNPTGAALYQFRLIQTVFWEYQGVAGYRLAGQEADATIRYMIVAFGDPYDPLNWGPPVTIGEPSVPITALVSSHDTLWVIKSDGVYSVTDATASAGGENITPYWRAEESALPVSTTAQIYPYYWRDKLIVARGSNIEAIDVNSWQVQDAPAPIQIGYGRPNDTGLNGRYTAVGSEGGYLLAGLQDFSSAATVLYGAPRRRESPVAGVTEFDWFPEIGPLPGQRVTAIGAFTPIATGRPTLWLGLQQTLGGTGTSLMAVDLFSGGSPLSDPGHRYHSSSSITFTDEQWVSRMAAKGALVGTAAVRNINPTAGRKVDVEVVGGPGEPFTGTPTFSITTLGTEVAHRGLHGTVSRAHTVRSKITLTTPTPTVPVVLDEWELRAHLGFPLRRRGSWLVELSDASRGDLADRTHTPEEDEILLIILCEGMEVVEAIQPDGETKLVVLDNVVPYEEQERPDSNRRTKVMKISYTQVS